MCPKCTSNRYLDLHLYELSEYCRYIGANKGYCEYGSTRIVTTEAIASWLRLAAELDEVQINSWKFDDGVASMYCGPVADQISSNSYHYSSYSTVLTRFIYVSSALEEACMI